MARLIDADKLEYFRCEDNKCDSAYDVKCQTCEYAVVHKYNIDNAPTVVNENLTSERKGEWTPVSEGLPKDMQKVWIWVEYYRYGEFNCKYQTYGIGYVCDDKWILQFIDGEIGWQDYRIIAWQPLPKPYKEVDND